MEQNTTTLTPEEINNIIKQNRHLKRVIHNMAIGIKHANYPKYGTNNLPSLMSIYDKYQCSRIMKEYERNL